MKQNFNFKTTNNIKRREYIILKRMEYLIKLKIDSRTTDVVQ